MNGNVAHVHVKGLEMYGYQNEELWFCFVGVKRPKPKY